MNRKLLNGLLVASLAIGSAMSVTSCKDTDEDLYAQLRDENATLDQKVNADIEALKTAQKALEEAQKKCKEDCETAWTNFKETGLEEWLNKYVERAGREQTLIWYLNQINSALTKENPDGTKTEYNTIGERFVALETALAALNNTNITEIPGLDEVAQWLKDHDNQTLPQVLQKAINADKQANENLAILQALLKGYENADGTFDLTKIQGLMKQAVDDAAAAKATADEAKETAVEAGRTASTAKEAADMAQKAVNALKTRVETVEKNIEKLTAKLDAMTGKLNHLITSIEIQQVKNPVFGKINLPLDVNSKMLVAYFGVASNVDFPPVNTSTTEYDGKSIVISAADQNLLGISTKNFNGYLGAEDGNLKLGSVYMTVNPTGVDPEGAQFELVNSQGVTSPVSLSRLEKSDEVLQFGVGGRAADQTFHSLMVADATLPVDKIDQVKLTLGSNFESEVEDLLKNHTLSDLAQVAKLIYGQFNNKLEATGVKAGWKYKQAILDEEGNPTGETETIEDATYSEFGIAATTFKPLSYKFLYGRHFKPLPTISPIEDFTLDSKLTITMPTFNFKFDNVTLDFKFEGITVSLAGTKIIVNIPETPVLDSNGNSTGAYIKPEPVIVDKFEDLEQAINSSLAKSLAAQDTKLQEAFKKAIGNIATQINGEINKEMDKLKTNIETQFDNIISEIQDKVNGYLGTVNNYIDKANSFLNRINRFIEDPNHYLQVTMLYSANDGAFHQVSNSSVAPTTLVLNGGDGITLHPTSYTYDMIAPSFKKYVAVTKVYDTKTGVTDEALTKAANNEAGLLNTVFPGNYTDVALKLTKGYTYEIVYSSLDYHGVTSTRKFYIAAE